MTDAPSRRSPHPASEPAMAAASDQPVLIRLEETAWERHGKTIILGSLAAALGIVGFTLVTFSVARREAAAAAAYADAKISGDFARIAQDFTGTPVAGDALIRLAAAHRASAEREQEGAALEEFLEKYPKHPMRSLAIIALGKNLRERGKPDLALAKFQDLFREFPGGDLASMAALHAGLSCLELDRKQEALSYFQQAASIQFNSIPAQQAALELKLLEAAGVVAQPTTPVQPETPTPDAAPPEPSENDTSAPAS